MLCSREDIERKRLAAIQRKISSQNSQANATNSPHNVNFLSSPAGPSQGPSGAGALRNSNSNANHSYRPYSQPRPEKNGYSPSNVPVTKVVSGTVYLITEEMFEVNPSEFCTPLINIFKTIPSRNFDPASKLWNFSTNDYDTLMSKVAPLAPHVVLGALPPYVLKMLKEKETPDPNSIDLSPVEATLRNKLMPFQADGVRYAISRRGRCMIADDMGLGKTFQALAVASYYRHDWPLLIVTTSSMRDEWQNKVHELLPSVPVTNVAALTGQRDAHHVADKQTEVVIVSFKVTTTHGDLLKNKQFGSVIIDESHNLKSHKAKCTVALNAICSRCTRVVLLSGTPALSRPAELYSQLTLIAPKLFPSYTEYGKRYCAGKLTAYGWDMTGRSNLKELQILLAKKFLIRRTKDEVLTLEEKTREAVFLDVSLLDFTPADQQGLNEMAQALKTRRPQDKQAALLTFFSESARVKIPAICKYVKQIIREESGKFLLFAHHRNMVNALCLTLDESCVPYICIVGDTPSNNRAELVDRFQTSPSCRCCVLSMTAAGAGITLTAAGLILFAELHWNPGVLIQAESRAHRLGRSGAVRVRYLLARGTVDDHIWPMLQDKLHVLNDVGLSNDSFGDTKTSHQQTNMNITHFFSPSATNNKEEIEKSFLEDEEGDALLAQSFLEDEEGDALLANLDCL